MLNLRVDLHAIDATPTHGWLIPTRLGAVAAVRELRVARRPREEALAFRAAVAEEREAEAVVVRDDAGHDEEDEQRQQKDARARHLVEPARAHGARRRDLCGNQPVRRVATTRPSWLGRAVRNSHRHAVEQASRRWRGGRRDDSARTRRKF